MANYTQLFTPPQITGLINAYLQDLPFPKEPRGLYDPIRYVLSLGGKRIRPALVLMAYNLYKGNVETALSQAIGLEVYHNYTLLHDDLMDRSVMRRGKPTVHKAWNDNTAVLSGDAMLVLAYQMMGRCDGVYVRPVLDLFGRTALEICEGQQLDMDFEARDNVTEGEYLEMIRLKTSVLLAASLAIGAILADAPQADVDNLYRLGMNMGVAFQLKDDLLDVYGDPAVFGKKIGGDILCNKKTFLLIHALRRASGEMLEELNHWMAAESFSPNEKIEAVTAIYNQLGVREQCEQEIAHYTTLAKESLNAVGVDGDRKKVLAGVMSKLICREV